MVLDLSNFICVLACGNFATPCNHPSNFESSIKEPMFSYLLFFIEKIFILITPKASSAIYDYKISID